MASIKFSDGPSSSRNQFRKKFAKRKVNAPKRKAAKYNPKIQKPSFKKIGKLSKPSNVKRKCFFYHELGHWKRNYPKYLEGLKAKKTQGNVPLHSIHVLELNYVNNSNDSWIVDSGATNHVCSSLQMLTRTRKFKLNEFTLRVGNGKSISAEAMR